MLCCEKEIKKKEERRGVFLFYPSVCFFILSTVVIMISGKDSITVVSHKDQPGICQRISNSLMAVIAGFLLLPMSCYLLYYNEGQSVMRAKSLDEGLSKVILLDTTEVAFEENNGKLVYASGPISTDKVVTDPYFNVAIHAVKLKRVVEMYQWVEHTSKHEVVENGKIRKEITYSYLKEWKTHHVDSSKFQDSSHSNPSSMVVESATFTAKPVKLGNFYLSDSLVKQINDYKPLPTNFLVQHDDYSPEISQIYQGRDPNNPMIGDLRIRYSFAGTVVEGDAELGTVTEISVVARQIFNQLAHCQTQAGGTLELLHIGKWSPEQIFNKEHSENNMHTWILRAIGFITAFFAFHCLTNIFHTLVDWVPLINQLVYLGLFFLNVFLATSFTVTVIAFCWLMFRPLYASALLLLVSIPWMLGWKRRGKAISARYLHKE